MTKPPKTLSAEARKLWRDLSTEYSIEDSAGIRLLQTACEALDSMRTAQALIDTHGVATLDKYDQLKANPACAVMRDSRAAMIASMKALNLDLEPLRSKPGRPGGT
ncbi:MAG: phage terminase small subunit P27 family [Gammaproteobacteria bacterium]|nr:phage terminase small subunit P27 family [Gammaproteobacteria bacterium]